MKYMVLLFALFSFSLLAEDSQINSPYVKTAYITDGQSIIIVFSERMSEEGLFMIENYNLVGTKQTGLSRFSTRPITISTVEDVTEGNGNTEVKIKIVEIIDLWESVSVTVTALKNLSNEAIDINRNTVSDSLMPPLLI